MRRFDAVLSRFELTLAVGLLFSVALASLFSFLLRNFAAGAPWVNDVSGIIAEALPHLVLMLGFAGSAIGISRNETIRIDLLERFAGEKLKIAVRIITALLTALLLGFFIYLMLVFIEKDHTALTVWAKYGYLPLFLLLTFRTITAIFLRNDEPAENINIENDKH